MTPIMSLVGIRVLPVIASLMATLYSLQAP
jgi:hypothetical protein